MKSPSACAIVALTPLLSVSCAWPILPKARNNQVLPERAATYSVVAVDGGSSGALATTETVTKPVTRTLLSTMILTTVAPESETPTTETIMITLPTTVVETGSLPPITVVTTTAVAPTTVTETPTSTTEETSTTSETADPIPPLPTASSEAPSIPSVTTLLASDLPVSTSAPTVQQTPNAIPQYSMTVVTTTNLATSTVGTPPQTVTVSPSQMGPDSTTFDDGFWHTTYYHQAWSSSVATASATEGSVDASPSETPTSSPTLYPYMTWESFWNATTNGALVARSRFDHS